LGVNRALAFRQRLEPAAVREVSEVHFEPHLAARYMTTLGTIVVTSGDGAAMREIQLREAKANLSAVIDDTVRGEPAVITRRGQPQAVILSFKDWQRLSRVPSFDRLLMAPPLGPDDLPERDQSPIRAADLL
jgi:prevent-host-death family protein